MNSAIVYHAVPVSKNIVNKTSCQLDMIYNFARSSRSSLSFLASGGGGISAEYSPRASIAFPEWDNGNGEP